MFPLSAARSSPLSVYLATLLALGVTVGTVACTDDASRTMGPATPVQAEGAGTIGSPEQQALEDIGKYVALALDDQGLRQRIINDMRNSPFREHKVELRSYLQGNSGGVLRAKVRQNADVDEVDFDELLASAPDLDRA